MTVVEVLVASMVSALVATGAAQLAVVGGGVTERSTQRLTDAAAIAVALERWPAEAARSVDQRLDEQGRWWLCGPPACGHGNEVVIDSPAPGWVLAGLDTVTVDTVTEVRLHWLLPDTTALTLVGWRGPP